MKSFYIIFIFIMIILMLTIVQMMYLNNTLDVFNKDQNIHISLNKKHNKQHEYEPREIIRNYDMRSKINPFEKQFNRPENHQLGDLKIRRFFDIPTRGWPDDFHIIGTLTCFNNKSEKETCDRKNKILNLYGRPRYPNGNSPYEYYTRISSGNEMIKIDLGERPELMDGDTIYIPELEVDYKLKKYPNDIFRYNPFVF